MKIQITATHVVEFEIPDDLLVEAFGTTEASQIAIKEHEELSNGGDYFISLLGDGDGVVSEKYVVSANGFTVSS